MNNLNISPFVIVTPVYEDSEAASRLFSELKQEYQDLVSIVAIDDGSIRDPLSLESLQGLNEKSVVLVLKRNIGHQRAIAVGISYASENFPNMPVVIMDSDGEDRPQSIALLLELLSSHADVDAVVATRKSRVESFRFQIFYSFYKFLFKITTGRQIDFGNFMALSAKAASRLSVMQELWIHVAASVLASKLRIDSCPIDRGPRYAGKSKMNFVGLALHGFKGLMVFAEDVFVRIGLFCALIASISMMLMPIPLILKLTGHATPGWSSVLIGVFLLIFIQTGTLTLLTLLLTGLIKGNGITDSDYKIYISRIDSNRLKS
jgi:glycosyltransferase involved in cell wall biosynthesis